MPLGVYEIESLTIEIKMIFIDEEHFQADNYIFQMKPNLSTLGSIIKFSPQVPIISFMPNDGLRDLSR